MFVVPHIIANNLGKIALTVAASALGALSYARRERIRSWFSEEDDDKSSGPTDTRPDGPAPVSNLNALHAELIETIAQANRDVLDEVREHMTDLRTALQGQLDTQRSEAQAFGAELRQAVEDLTCRQNTVEQFLQGKLPGEVFAVPGRQRSAEAPRRQEPGTKPGPNGKRKTNGSNAAGARAA